jgi:hypothetical protein
MFEELKAVKRNKDHTRPNAALEKAIEEVKSKYPHMFLQEHELKNRRFYDEPEYAIPMAGALRSYAAPQFKKPTRKKK